VLPNCMKSYGEWNTIAFGRGIVLCFAGGTNNDRTQSVRPLVPPFPRTTSRRDGHPSSGQVPAKKGNLVGANKDRERGGRNDDGYGWTSINIAAQGNVNMRDK
jgi:hypothetical protein